MNVAILGGGTLGSHYAEMLSQINDTQLVGVYDPQIEVAQTLASHYDAVAFNSIDELLSSNALDVVINCLPVQLQKENTMRVLESGKHVFSEATSMASLSDVEHIVEQTKKGKGQWYVGFPGRFTAPFMNLRQQMTADKIGEAGVAHFQRWTQAREEIINEADADYDRGVINEWMIHDLDLVRWLLGEVRSVYAKRRKEEDIDYALVTLRLNNDAIVNLQAVYGDSGPTRHKIELAGKSGVIRYDNQQTHSFEMRTKRMMEGQNTATIVSESPMAYDPSYIQLSHVFDCMRSGEQPNVTMQDMLQALRIADGADRSINTGMPVRLEEM